MKKVGINRFSDVVKRKLKNKTETTERRFPVQNDV